jgi:hypothetical protein
MGVQTIAFSGIWVKISVIYLVNEQGEIRVIFGVTGLIQ